MAMTSARVAQTRAQFGQFALDMKSPVEEVLATDMAANLLRHHWNRGG
jgi:hypothetical protein